MRQNKNPSKFPLQWSISLGLPDKADDALQRPHRPGFIPHTPQTTGTERSTIKLSLAQTLSFQRQPLQSFLTNKYIHHSTKYYRKTNRRKDYTEKTVLESQSFTAAILTCKNRILFLPHCPTLPFNSSLLNVLCNVLFHTVTFFPKSLGPKCASSVCLIIFGKL